MWINFLANSTHFWLMISFDVGFPTGEDNMLGEAWVNILEEELGERPPKKGKIRELFCEYLYCNIYTEKCYFASKSETISQLKQTLTI